MSVTATEGDQPARPPAPDMRLDPLCLVLGWVWPGLGYLRIGQRRRGLRVMIGLLALVIIGVLVGGVDVVDRQDDGLWFLPQALMGPMAFGIDYLNRAFVKTGTIGMPSIGRVNELGTLFVALAGLMNLATMIDCATRPTHDTPPQRGGDRHDGASTDDDRPRRTDKPDLVERRQVPRTEGSDETAAPQSDAEGGDQP